MAKHRDPVLLKALEKAYAARARLFHDGIRAAKIDLLIADIDGIDSSTYDWSLPDLGISQTAMSRVLAAGGDAVQVFVHPALILAQPHLIAYYRNLAAISRKGISQLLFATTGYENRRRQVEEENATKLCRALNEIISKVIDSTPEYSVAISRQTILAEIGTELQGTWANTIGRGAAKSVEDLFERALTEGNMGSRLDKRTLALNNGWKIQVAAEPDLAFSDRNGVTRIAIEIKGSLDKAGAQTRYGEAKKTFSKELRDNPRCHTIYLASCYTDAVIRQIESDGQVRARFNLTSILYDDTERDNFLAHVFHIVNAP
ncbi:MAG: XcyI family restriction endonuclease [Phycisphaerales bacterium]|nr:XcyI family restriction endonuclease [Phycisphaerales bacterium]